MHFSVHGHPAAEIIFDRANAEKDFMGLTSWTGALPRKSDAEIARQKADAEYDKFKERTQYQLSPVEIHFLEQFEREQKRLGGKK